MRRKLFSLSLALSLSVLLAMPALALSPAIYSADDSTSVAATGAASIVTILFTLISMLCSCIFPVGMFVIFGLLFILWLIMLIDVIRREENEFPPGGKDQKMLWLLVVLLTSYLGAAIYYFMIYRKYPLKKK